MRLINEFYVDENNNKWDRRLFSLEKATECSKSLVECYFNVNCTNSMYCQFCTNCNYMQECYNCYECQHSYRCNNCVGVKYGYEIKEEIKIGSGKYEF